MIDRIIRHRWIALLVFMAAVMGLSTGLKSAMVPDNALTVWFLQTDPQLQAYHQFQKNFGNDEVILLHLHEPKGVFTPEALLRLERLHARFDDIEGVDQITSILNIQDVWNKTEGLVFDKLIPTPIPKNPHALARIHKRAIQNSILVDRLIDATATQAMVWIQMQVMDDIDTKRDRIVSDVRAAAKKVLGHRDHALGGIGVIYSGLNQITQHDFGLFVSLSYLIMFLLLWWIFRSFRFVIASIGVILAGTAASLGIYGLLGYQVNMVTVVLPILIIVLGIADAVHFPAIFVQVSAQQPSASAWDRTQQTLKIVLLPCLLTTLTTMAGFFALASSPMAVIRQLGVFAAIGLGVSLLASTIFMTLVFMRAKKLQTLPQHLAIGRILSGCHNLLVHRAWIPATLTVLVVIGSAWGYSRVKTDTYTIGYLPEDHQVVQDHTSVETKWGPYTVLDFLVQPNPEHTLQSHDVLNAIENFIQKSIALPEIRSGFSLASLYRRMADVFGAEKPKNQPWRADEIAQLSLLIESQGFVWDRGKKDYKDNLIAPFANQDYDLGRLFLTTRMQSASQLDALLTRLHKIAQTTMHDVGKLEASGYPPLYVRIIDYIMSSQIRSFILAVAIIFMLMLVWLRSYRLAFLSLVPNLFPVLVMMGAMGALGIYLDIATVTVAAIVIGVAIDDTVHFLHHWRQAENAGASWSQAIEITFQRAGKAAVTTSLLLLLGFPILLLAGVKTVVYFGILVMVAAGAALFGDLFLLPLLLRLWPARIPDRQNHSTS